MCVCVCFVIAWYICVMCHAFLWFFFFLLFLSFFWGAGSWREEADCNSSSFFFNICNADPKRSTYAQYVVVCSTSVRSLEKLDFLKKSHILSCFGQLKTDLFFRTPPVTSVSDSIKKKRGNYALQFWALWRYCLRNIFLLSQSHSLHHAKKKELKKEKKSATVVCRACMMKTSQ